MRVNATMLVGAATLAALGGCGRPPEVRETSARSATAATASMVVHDTTVVATLDAAGIAEPLRQATLGTRLMGTVTEVAVREGDRVARGQLLVRIDAGEIAARRGQARAAVAGAEAMHEDAATQAARIRGLYADSAATRAQLDAAEAGLRRADAGVQQARAGLAEADALGSYAEVRAPFAGTVTRRSVDPGAFAAPGTPLVTVQDVSAIRVRVTVTPDAARSVRRGDRLEGVVEGVAVDAIVEGAVPAAVGSVYTVNAVVANAAGRVPAGGAATLRIPAGERQAILVPRTALVHEGELTGVRVQGTEGADLRWVRLGAERGERVEVLSGLRDGERVLLAAEEGR